MKGVDILTVKELMRHRAIKMTLRYAHLSRDHKRKAIEDIYSGHDMDTAAEKQSVTSNISIR